MNFSSNALISTGVVLYYSANAGYRVISPTLEAGLFSSIGLLSASSTIPTYTGGTTLAAFNQVTSVAATTTGGTVGVVGGTAYETGAYATGMVYDFSKGTAEAGMYAMSSGMILGYSALTVLPSQLLLTAVDGPILIAYDGPRVVIAAVKGNYAGFDDAPTGTVINLEEAKKDRKG